MTRKITILDSLDGDSFIKDYPVESGNDGSNIWEKYRSGKVKIEGVQTVSLNSSGTGTITLPVTLPHATVTKTKILIMPAWFSTQNVTVVYHGLTTTTVDITCINVASGNPITGNQRVSIDITSF